MQLISSSDMLLLSEMTPILLNSDWELQTIIITLIVSFLQLFHSHVYVLFIVTCTAIVWWQLQNNKWDSIQFNKFLCFVFCFQVQVQGLVLWYSEIMKKYIFSLFIIIIIIIIITKYYKILNIK